VTARPSFTCPRCQAVSAHPDDVANRYCGACHIFTGDLAGLLCPLCRQPPMWLLGGGTQAFCGTEDCKAVTWNPMRTVDENLTDVSFIDLGPFAPG
jgi:hypothetical protein